MIGSLARFVGVVIGRSISFGLNSYYTHSKTANRLNWHPHVAVYEGTAVDLKRVFTELVK